MVPYDSRMSTGIRVASQHDCRKPSQVRRELESHPTTSILYCSPWDYMVSRFLFSLLICSILPLMYRLSLPDFWDLLPITFTLHVPWH